MTRIRFQQKSCYYTVKLGIPNSKTSFYHQTYHEMSKHGLFLFFKRLLEICVCFLTPSFPLSITSIKELFFYKVQWTNSYIFRELLTSLNIGFFFIILHWTNIDIIFIGTPETNKNENLMRNERIICCSLKLNMWDFIFHE